MPKRPAFADQRLRSRVWRFVTAGGFCRVVAVAGECGSATDPRPLVVHASSKAAHKRSTQPRGQTKLEPMPASSVYHSRSRAEDGMDAHTNTKVGQSSTGLERGSYTSRRRMQPL